jgi:hypothetical protein
MDEEGWRACARYHCVNQLIDLFSHKYNEIRLELVNKG